MKHNPRVAPTLPKGSIFTETLLATLVTEGDCFGAFDASVSECHGCHDQYACAMFQQVNIKKAVTAVEKESGPFLDQTKFPTQEQIDKILVPGKTYDEVLKFFKENSVCPDTQTIEIFMDSAIRSKDLRVKAGILC